MLPAVPVARPGLAGIIYEPTNTGGYRRLPMVDRVVVFVDYQNVYMSARQAFHPSPWAIPHWEGQIDPLALGQLIVRRSPFDRKIVGVRMYRGIPDSTKDPKGHGACLRHIAAWSKSEAIEVVARPLRYPAGWPKKKPKEKGVDVALAVDFVLMAVRQDYEVGAHGCSTRLRSGDPDFGRYRPHAGARGRCGSGSSPGGSWRLVKCASPLESPGYRCSQSLVPLARCPRLHVHTGPARLHPGLIRRGITMTDEITSQSAQCPPQGGAGQRRGPSEANLRSTLAVTRETLLS